MLLSECWLGFSNSSLLPSSLVSSGVSGKMIYTFKKDQKLFFILYSSGRMTSIFSIFQTFRMSKTRLLCISPLQHIDFSLSVLNGILNSLIDNFIIEQNII
jgi:hypothetical protein